MPERYYVHGLGHGGQWDRRGPMDMRNAEFAAIGFRKAGYSHVTISTDPDMMRGVPKSARRFPARVTRGGQG